MIPDAPCLVDEKAPACRKTVTPALESQRFRANFTIFKRSQNTTEHRDHLPDPTIEQEEVGMFGLVHQIDIEVVTHPFQHILPRHLKRQGGAFWTEKANAFIPDYPPCQCMKVIVSGRMELSFPTTVGVRRNFGVGLSDIA